MPQNGCMLYSIFIIPMIFQVWSLVKIIHVWVSSAMRRVECNQVELGARIRAYKIGVSWC